MQWNQSTIRRLEQTILDGGSDVDLATDLETIAAVSTTEAATPAGAQAARDYIDVRKWGASPSATAVDNQAAIQAAIDEANGERPVYLYPGVYTVGGTRTGAFNSIFTYVSGTEFYGDGDASVLRIITAFTAGGDYRLFSPVAAVATDNVKFHRFKVDGNAANNIVAGSSGGDVRQAYMIHCYAGDHVTVDDVTFVDCPGRNIIVLGDNGSVPSIRNGRVINCRFSNMGGGISGNHAQNDHSTVYTQFDSGLVANNEFSNPAIINPASPATRTVCALEIHGSRTLVQGNRVTNYTHGGNAVAGVMNSIGNSWVDNKFNGLTKLGTSLWSIAGFTHADLTIRGNVYEMHSDLNTVISGIYQFPDDTGVGEQIENLTISGNTFYSDYSTPDTGAWHGVYLTAVDGAKIVRNTFRNVSGDPVILDDHNDLPLDIEHVDISGNTIDNWGYHTTANRMWAVLLLNSDTAGSTFNDIKIYDNRITKPTSAGTARGISIQGAGRITRVTVDGLDKISNVANLGTIATNTATNYDRVSIVPKTLTDTTATAVTSGIWLKGDQVLHTDVTVAGTIGKVCTTAGAASSGGWAAATAYTKGQWIRTSTSKVLECIVAGTSHASTEPAPTVLGDPVTDNTVTWAYRSSSLAVLTTHGTPAATVSIIAPSTFSLPAGALYATARRTELGGVAFTLTSSGRLHLFGIELFNPTTVTNISFMSVGAAVTPTNWWFGLFDSSRVCLGLTADQTTTAWGASIVKTLAVAGGAVSVTTDGLYYLGIMVAAATPPTLACTSAHATAAWNLVAPILSGISDTGLTTPPALPYTPAAMGTARTQIAWAWVS